MTPNNTIPVVDEVDDKVIPPQNTIVVAFRSHRLDREKARKYIKKLCKNSGPEVAKMIGDLPLHIDNAVERNTLEAIDREDDTVMRFNLKRHGAVFV